MSLQYRNHDYYLIPKILPYALENSGFGIGGCDYYVRVNCTWLNGIKARLKSKLVNSTCNIWGFLGGTSMCFHFAYIAWEEGFH